uniref:Uncharacterized protein n=1 Tax=Ditylenchus dipsaci TaxID=166011 RepID=A0A915D2J6_9BILA
MTAGFEEEEALRGGFARGIHAADNHQGQLQGSRHCTCLLATQPPSLLLLLTTTIVFVIARLLHHPSLKMALIGAETQRGCTEEAWFKSFLELSLEPHAPSSTYFSSNIYTAELDSDTPVRTSASQIRADSQRTVSSQFLYIPGWHSRTELGFGSENALCHHAVRSPIWFRPPPQVTSFSPTPVKRDGQVEASQPSPKGHLQLNQSPVSVLCQSSGLQLLQSCYGDSSDDEEDLQSTEFNSL